VHRLERLAREGDGRAAAFLAVLRGRVRRDARAELRRRRFLGREASGA
jgi:hypothetical protein